MAGTNLELILSPEAQSFCGIAAGVMGVIGLFVWSVGIRLARPVTAIGSGLAVAGVAIWGLPQVTSLAPVTAGIIGFVAGLLFGAVTFRFLQAFAVAGVLALVVGGVYYRTNIAPEQAATAVPQAASSTLPAKEMLIKLDRLELSPDAAKKTRLDTTAVLQAVKVAAGNAQRLAEEQWVGISQGQRRRLMVLEALAAIAGLLIGLFFPKGTTWAMTAAMGTLVISGAAVVLVQVYAPQYANLLPTNPAVVWGILGGIMGVGMIMQRAMFWPGKQKESKPRPDPKPVPGTLPGEPAAA